MENLAGSPAKRRRLPGWISASNPTAAEAVDNAPAERDGDQGAGYKTESKLELRKPSEILEEVDDEGERTTTSRTRGAHDYYTLPDADGATNVNHRLSNEKQKNMSLKRDTGNAVVESIQRSDVSKLLGLNNIPAFHDRTEETALVGVVFSISGLVNPERAELRDMCLEMGAKFQPIWSNKSTLLLCALFDTPTFKQVKAANGTIVNKDWIVECYRKKELVDIETYLMHMGKPWRVNTGGDVTHDSDLSRMLSQPAQLSAADNEGGIKQQIKPVLHYNDAQSSWEDPQKKIKVPGVRDAQQTCEDTAGMMKNFSSIGEVQAWASEDLSSITEWLGNQADKPGPAELQTVALQGLSACLEDTVKSLQDNLGLSMIVDNWGFIPRAVKELALVEAKGKQCCQGDCTKIRLTQEAKRLRGIYEAQFRKFSDSQENGMVGRNRSEGPKQSLVGEDWDDDATERLSEDSRDLLDFDSDETETLSETDVAKCKLTILQMFS